MNLSGFQRLVTAASLGCIGVLFLASCGPSLTPEQQYEQRLLADIESGYSMALASRPPTHVVITYPVSIERLSDLKKKELGVVRKLLDERDVSYTLRRREDAIVTVDVPGRELRQFQCYDIPEDRIPELTGKVLLYVNLDAGEAPKTVLHPLAKKHSITVVIWDDPVATKGRGSRTDRY
jgi:hypothetical protein